LPIYEFVCQECQALVEFFVRSPDQEMEMRCSSCGSGELRRVLSRVNSSIQEPGGGGKSLSAGSPLQERICTSGSCSTLTLPGHTRQG